MKVPEKPNPTFTQIGSGLVWYQVGTTIPVVAIGIVVPTWYKLTTNKQTELGTSLQSFWVCLAPT